MTLSILIVALALEAVDLSAMVWRESRGVVAAVSARGAVGLCQVMPAYSRFSARELSNPWINLWACVEARAYWKRHCGVRWRAGYRQGWKGCKKWTQRS